MINDLYYIDPTLAILKRIEKNICILQVIGTTQLIESDISCLHYKNMIDPLLKNLIIELNLSGFITGGTCQGKQSLWDFKKRRHGPDAYLSFVGKIPEDIQDRLKDNGLNVYGNGRGIGINRPLMESAYYEHSPKKYRLKKDEKLYESIVNENKLFIERVKRAFRFR